MIIMFYVISLKAQRALKAMIKLCCVLLRVSSQPCFEQSVYLLKTNDGFFSGFYDLGALLLNQSGTCCSRY